MNDLKTLFDLALASESIMRSLYRRSAKFFSHLPRIVEFCARMEKDEILHIEKLLALRDSLSLEQLSQPVDPGELKALREIKKDFPDEAFEKMENLDDFYELANELEFSETNAIFQSLFKKHSPSSRETRSFLLLHDTHQENLVVLSEEFPRAERQKILTAR